MFLLQGIGSKQAKLSSVKKLLILAVVLDTPENYDSIKLILDSLNIQGVEYTTQADIKLLRILVGKASGNPKHGCPFCNAAFPYLEVGELYCVHDLLELNQRFVDAGSNLKKQSKFDNVIHKPLLSVDESEVVLGLLAPPELHMLIGVVDKLLSGIENNVFSTKEEGKTFMDKFLKRVNYDYFL